MPYDFKCPKNAYLKSLPYELLRLALNWNQGQKFVAVFKAKNRGAATSYNDKNRGIVAAKIVKIAAVSRQKS